MLDADRSIASYNSQVLIQKFFKGVAGKAKVTT